MNSTTDPAQGAWQKIFLDPPSFDTTSAYKTLLTLATQPLDLTQDEVITAERIKKYRAKGAGFTYLYACERVTDETLEALYELARERKVPEAMLCMQRGDPINFIAGFESERRAVLHTATRDLFEAHQTSPIAMQARNASLDEHKKLKSFLESIGNKFTDMIFVGIGGSELGPRALYQSLAAFHNKNRSVHFIGNVDPDDVADVLEKVDLKKALVVVISKSGTTIETATNEQFLRSAYEKQGLKPSEHFIAVTMPKTPMDDSSAYLEQFYLWDYVGGRYSGTSMVGGVLLGFTVGYEAFYELCKGAHDMDGVALIKDEKQNLPLLAALIGVWNRNFLHYQTLGVIPYSRCLMRFPAHLQQCDMESNGKRIDRKANATKFQTGPIVWGEPGTNAQHSFFQLLHQGTGIVPLELIGFMESQYGVDFEYKGTTSQEKLLSNMFAQSIALARGQKNANPNKQFPGNRPSSLLLARRLTPYTLGSLLSFYENKIAFQGFLWGINSFDQEGVQLGKVLADKTCALFAASREGKVAEQFPVAEALLEIAETV